MMEKSILDAINKMPKATEVWMHDNHSKEDFSMLGIKVKYSPLMPPDQFMLSEKDLSAEIDNAIKKFNDHL